MTVASTQRNYRWLAKQPDYYERWHSQHLGYRCWRSMKARCSNPSFTGYENYGGRGITVYPPWMSSYEEFIKYIGERPSLEYSIDRIDTNGNYEPGNVRWATRSEQQRNKRPGNSLEVRSRLVTEVATGKSYAAIAKDLNKEGVLTPRGRTWSRQNVKDAAVRAALDLL